MSARSPYVASSLGHVVVLGLLLTVAALQRSAPLVPLVRIVALPTGGRPGPKAVTPPPSVPVPEPQVEVPKPAPPVPKPEIKKEPLADKTPAPREPVKAPDPKGIKPPVKQDVVSKSKPVPPPKTTPAVAPAHVEPVQAATGDGAVRPTAKGDVGVEADGDPGPLTGYLGLLRDKVEANWEPPATLGRHGAVQAVIAFEISRTGGFPLPNSMQVRVSSGQPAFDRAAQRAVLNAAPFAPLPAGWGTDSIGIRFTFSGEY